MPIHELIQKYLRNEASDAELQLMLGWMRSQEKEASAIALQEAWETMASDAMSIPPVNLKLMWQNIQLELSVSGEEKQPNTHRVHFLKTAWIRYAAAIIIALGLGTYLYIANQKEKPSVTQTNPVPVQNDVKPGGSRATLTLADGSKINLDEAKSGTIATEGKTKISKIENQVIYDARLSKEVAISYNTMTTPRGGQYQLTLPDGTRVWLNAESSITYPIAFNSNERKVTITGEAYFEVAKDKKKPFRVNIANATIEVLGTRFNVNTYKEESTFNTTLIEGSVRIKSVHTSLTLKPGQQGQLNPRNEKLSLAANPDVDQVMAWKNGLFNFDDADLKTVMRQIQRWYDVEVVYEIEPGQRKFGGEIQRNLNLSDLLEGLQKTDIHFRIQGKKIFISR